MSGEMSLVERLISLAPDQLAHFRSSAGHGDGVSGSKRAARLIKDNLQLIEAAIDVGVTRLAILNAINQSLPENMQIKLSGFETARYRYRARGGKEPVSDVVGSSKSTASVLVKENSVNND